MSVFPSYVWPTYLKDPVLFPEAPVQINIGLSLGALFDLREAGEFRRKYGQKLYKKTYMASRVGIPFGKGPSLPLVKALTRLNKKGQEPLVRFFILSLLSETAKERVRLSLSQHKLVSNGNPEKEGFFDFYGHKTIAPYMTKEDCGLDLLLSTRPNDVTAALESGVPAGHVDPNFIPETIETKDIRIGFDLDRAAFTFFGKPGTEGLRIDNEAFTRMKGVPSAHMREHALRKIPGHPGPIAPFFLKLFPVRDLVNPDPTLPDLSLLAITARSGNAAKRAQKTIKTYGLTLDDFISTGWDPKGPIVAQQGVCLFFDDGAHNIQSCRAHSPWTLAVHLPWTEKHVDRCERMPRSTQIARQVACSLGS